MYENICFHVHLPLQLHFYDKFSKMQKIIYSVSITAIAGLCGLVVDLYLK